MPCFQEPGQRNVSGQRRPACWTAVRVPPGSQAPDRRAALEIWRLHPHELRWWGPYRFPKAGSGPALLWPQSPLQCVRLHVYRRLPQAEGMFKV